MNARERNNAPPMAAATVELLNTKRQRCGSRRLSSVHVRRVEANTIKPGTAKRK